jgi:hypothetical protein
MLEAPVLNTLDTNAVLASLHQQMCDILRDVQFLDSSSMELWSSGARLQHSSEALQKANSELRRSWDALQASSCELQDHLDNITAVRQSFIVEVVSY